MRRFGLVLLTLGGCFTDATSAGACEEGTAGCPCASGACGDGLECTQTGYCLDPTCVDGIVHCPCYANGTCNDGLMCTAGDFCKPREGSTSSDATATSTSQGSTVTTVDPSASTSTMTATSMSATTAGSSGTLDCSTCPTGHCLENGTCARYVFVTDQAFAPDLGGLAGGDARCNEAANGSDLPGTYAVFARDDDVDARDHAEIDAIEGAAFVLPGDGEVLVAASPDGITTDADTAILHPIDRNAAGMAVSNGGASTACGDAAIVSRVWTGYAANADDISQGATCASWTDTGQNGSTGRFDRMNAAWVRAANCPCSDGTAQSRAHLYCVELPPA